MSWLVRLSVIALVLGASVGGYRYWNTQQLYALKEQKMEEWNAQRDKLNEVLDQFRDALDVLDAVPVLQMAPHVEKLQALNRRLEKIPLPGCFDSWKKLEATDDLIFIYLTHMKDPSDSAFLKNRNYAQLALREATTALNEECSFINATLRAYQEVRQP